MLPRRGIRWRTNHGCNADKCPYLKVTVLDINEERISQWNDNLDELPVYDLDLKIL